MEYKEKEYIEDIYEDCWMYVLLLTTLVILIGALKTYYFELIGIRVTYSVFLLPFIFLITNFITKVFDYKKAVSAIAISGVMYICFMAVISFAMGKSLILSSLSGEFCGYVISQFVNLSIYYFLLKNTKMPTILLFITNLFSLIVFYMFYTLIYLEQIQFETFWSGYLLTLGIQFIICIPISIIDKRIKKNRLI